MAELMIGWSEADITPATDKSISLAGQYYVRLTREIHSRLKTVAVAFSSGEKHFLLASMDNVGVAEAFQKLVREAVVALEPAIDPESIFINAIHSHSAPSAKPPKKIKGANAGVCKEVGNSDGRAVLNSLDSRELIRDKENAVRSDIYTPEEYIAFVVPIMAQNLVAAWHDRQPGGIARAFGCARVGHCRRPVFADGTAEMYGDTTRLDFVGMEAGEDSGVDMLFTFDKTGRKTGMLLNVACPSQVMESTYKVSSDFAGATRELLKKEYGEEFHTLYQISPAGCQSPRDLVRHYTTEPDFWHEDGVAEIANRLLAAVRNARPGEIDYDPVFERKSVRVTLPRRRVSWPDYRKAKAELARLLAIKDEDTAYAEFCANTHAAEKRGGHGPYDDKTEHFVCIKNQQAEVERFENQDDVPTISFDMLVARIGDVAIASNPFELYLYYGQNIKARSKAHQTFLVQLAAGASIHAGYLPSPDAEKFGGYGGMVINGQCGSDAGFMLADRTVEEINELFS